MREAFTVGARQLHCLEEFVDALLCSLYGSRNTVHDEWLCHVLRDRQQRVETRPRILEHEPDLLAQGLKRPLLEADHFVAKDGE